MRILLDWLCGWDFLLLKSDGDMAKASNRSVGAALCGHPSHITHAMSLKSKTCTGKKTGKPLTEYGTESEAREAALYASAEHKRHLTPYLCQTCNKWHLSPARARTYFVRVFGVFGVDYFHPPRIIHANHGNRHVACQAYGMLVD